MSQKNIMETGNSYGIKINKKFVICNSVREGCEGCNHSIPHESLFDYCIDVNCDVKETECDFHNGIIVKCIEKNNE